MAAIVGARDERWSRNPEPWLRRRARAALAIAVRPSARASIGIAVLLAVVLAGFLVHLPQVARRDLRVDVALAHWRTPMATALALALTTAAKEVVGIAVVGLGTLVLLVRRRIRSAVQLLLTAGLAWGFAYAVKVGVDRARPPAALELLLPDASPGFPSGHTTTAVVMVVVVWSVLAGAGRFRVVATLAALAFAFGVAASRVYLADHYPTDVAASFAIVLAATLLVSAAADGRVARRGGAAPG